MVKQKVFTGQSDILSLRKAPILNELTNTQFSQITACSKLKKYKKGNLLFFHGDLIEHFYIILNGWVKLSRETEDGRESLADVLTRGDIFGENAIFGDSIFPFSGQAVDNNVAVLELPIDIISELIKNDPKLGLVMLGSLSQRTYQLRTQIEYITVMSAHQRIVSFLLKQYRTNRESFELPFDKSLIATYLGMKPETFSRTMSDLKKMGVIVKGSTVTIENIQKLADYCLLNSLESRYNLPHLSKVSA